MCEVWYEIIPSYSTTENFAYVRINLLREKKFREEMLSFGRHYCNAKVYRLYVKKYSRIVNHALCSIFYANKDDVE